MLLYKPGVIQRKRRRANKYAKEMKHQKRYLSRRLANISPFNSIHESLNRRTSTSLDNGMVTLITVTNQRNIQANQ